MKQILQSFKTGEMWLAEVPAPLCRANGAVVKTAASFVSAGTERMLAEFAKKGLVGKALQMPDQVKKVLRKMKTEGIFSTLEKVQAKLDQPIPLGYSCAGIVVEAGRNCGNLNVGDRVACGGAGFANHAEYDYVPRNLLAKIPDGVSFEDASCTTVGSIALQGVRQCEVRLGETVAVIGLGLMGILAVQMLKASGCRVVGFDPNAARCKLAEDLGCDCAVSDNLLGEALSFSDGHGVDAVLITAATHSDEPVTVAAEICRQKGRVVATGLVGMNLPRDAYYKKEIDFRLSCSYGPGRYDPVYEEQGIDYPFGYVRWTEQRNMAAFLQLVAEGKVTPSRLVTHRFPFDGALDAYQLLLGVRKEPYLGIVLDYGPLGTADDQFRTGQSPSLPKADSDGLRTGQSPSLPKMDRDGLWEGRALSRPDSDIAPETFKIARRVDFMPRLARSSSSVETVGVSFIGCGNFAKAVLLPALKKTPDVRLRGICTASGMSCGETGRKEGFAFAATDQAEVLKDVETQLVMVTTRHDLHAGQVSAVLKAGKCVFSEKPLAISEGQLDDLRGVVDASDQMRVMVGFNRRFSPHAKLLKDYFAQRTQPLVMHYRVNAGQIPKNVWIQDPSVGGGRMVGEGCHFIDFMSFVCGAPVAKVQAFCIQTANAAETPEDSICVNVQFVDGSVGTLEYAALGDTSLPKERCEIHGEGSTAVMDNFCTTVCSGWLGKRKLKGRQQKGFAEELAATVAAVRAGAAMPITWGEIENVTRATFAILKAVKSGESEAV